MICCHHPAGDALTDDPPLSDLRPGQCGFHPGYGAPAGVDTPSFLKEYDQPLIQPQTRTALLHAWQAVPSTYPFIPPALPCPMKAKAL